MQHPIITSIDNTPMLQLTQEVLDQVGISVGDEVDLTVINRTLILRPLEEVEREQTIASLTRALFERRQRVYAALAAGSE
ncbi:MAG: AbrB/MazE/SpoVT family DNA-binding domain-containing protein [Ardenticatenia bacterium]|nr:AbrB/MazE/SpoVT family DNA-binding domain-containing protein [Ardenticatenia bacterium]